MKTSRRFLLSVLMLTGFAAASSVAGTQADSDFAALTAMAEQLPPWASRGPDGRIKSDRAPKRSEWMHWIDRQSQARADAALKFMTDHPADARRWDAAAVALNAPRFFVAAIKPGYDEAAAARDQARMESLIEYDNAAKAAWTERMHALETALLAAPDASADAVGEALFYGSTSVYQDTTLTAMEKLKRFRAFYATFAQRAPQSRYFPTLSRELLRQAKEADPTAYPGLLQEMKQSPNADIAAFAAGRIQAEAALEKGFDLKFTAVDGRAVDIAKLRGKVVLIDFWATWCGPCIRELPNLKAVYDKYHDRGFEVVGISLDREGDRQKLIDFCKEHGMPWPQHFDGKYWKNEYAVQYGIQAIPAMFLLGPDGKLATTEARGEKLEAEVKRLLKL